MNIKVRWTATFETEIEVPANTKSCAELEDYAVAQIDVETNPDYVPNTMVLDHDHLKQVLRATS